MFSVSGGLRCAKAEKRGHTVRFVRLVSSPSPKRSPRARVVVRVRLLSALTILNRSARGRSHWDSHARSLALPLREQGRSPG